MSAYSRIFDGRNIVYGLVGIETRPTIIVVKTGNFYKDKYIFFLFHSKATSFMIISIFILFFVSCSKPIIKEKIKGEYDP